MSAVRKPRDPAAEARRIEAIRRACRTPEYRAEQSLLAALKRNPNVDAEVIVRQLERARDPARNAAGKTAYYPTPINARRRQYRIIPCLCCGNKFRSQGPHNRLCQKCRTMPVSPFEP